MIKILDHGYITLVDKWGSDESIIEAARMSTNKGFQGWGTDEKPGDEKLLRFLWKNKHYTPFEMAGLVFEIKAPIFVFREWHRHRVPHSYNETSARYVPLPNENYLPDFEVLMQRVQAQTDNKQAQAIAAGDHPQSSYKAWLELVERMYEHMQAVYEDGLRLGVPKEIARIVLPVARYSRMRWQSNLRGVLHFMGLRCAKNAQWEIREYAKRVATYVEVNFPRTYELFREGMEHGSE